MTLVTSLSQVPYFVPDRFPTDPDCEHTECRTDLTCCLFQFIWALLASKYYT